MFTEEAARRVKSQVEATTSGSSGGSSYIYPVRSLLSGIKPVAGQRSSLTIHDESALSDAEVNEPSFSHEELVRQLPQEAISGGEVPSNSLVMSPSADLVSTSDIRRRRRPSPNFRDFPPNEDPLSQRTFSTAQAGYFPRPDPDYPSAKIDASSPTGSPVIYAVADDGVEEGFGYRHPAQFAQVAADAFAHTAQVLVSQPPDSDSDQSLHSHFSHKGIVHLPPLASAPSSTSSRSRGRTSRSSGKMSDINLESVQEVEIAQLPSTQGSRPVSPAPAGDIVTGSRSSQTDSSISDGSYYGFRYRHVLDENGHHLIVGREGKLTKCEDEPIRTPGAVQGFGILIAVEENEETGNLVVRQVSENSTELLGLSPRYLFSLACFSETLSEQQSDILFDNIQYLTDTSLSPEEQAENLHVFMLSGWGEPNTAFPDTMSRDPHNRRNWTCWCAAHRPQMVAPTNLGSINDDSSTNSHASTQSLIILEFELEKDTFNPLYPPFAEEGSFQSGVSSPSNGSISTSNSSARTLVSSASASSEERMVTPEDSTSSLVSSDSSVVTGQIETSSTPSQESSAYNFPGPDDWMPSPEEIMESTTSRAKPLLALERLRRTRKSAMEGLTSPNQSNTRQGPPRRRRGTGTVGMMDVFAVMAQINEQLGSATDLETFLKVVAGVIKDLTQFHRVLVYQFDEVWNGQVVAELVDWDQTHDLYRGLHFPASDIPAQARNLYALNRVRLLYDRGQPTARLVVRNKSDLETPLDMTHCYLRAMSPIHLKYLENMGVRASMSVSIMAFGSLWGLVACHSYGLHGMRVSFPVRQMLRLLSQSISRNIERLTYAQRLHTRKLINTGSSEQHPTGYIVSNADDLLGLFDADYGVLVIGEGAKILGPNQHGQEILIVAEYLRLKQFDTIQVSQAVTQDYPDLQLANGLEVIAGLLYVPLSAGGRDFIAFLRKGQPRQVRWAGRPFKDGEQRNILEPRASFRTWSETVAGRCRAWSDEHLETAGVLALVYGKFIEVWRQKESALQTTKLTNLLLSNASHEVRTPLNHIINYLELALNGSLDTETRENLSQSHAASKSLLFTINDLLDLTRLESGNETSFNEVFNLHRAIEDATLLYRNEAMRRGLGFKLDVSNCPKLVVGDSRKIRTVVANLAANALKYTDQGSISVQCHAFEEPIGLRNSDTIAVEIVVSDTGYGIPSEKLECIFREFEQVESAPSKSSAPGLGLGLAVVARIVEQLGGQLRVDSRINEGSRFSFLIPFSTEIDGSISPSPSCSPSSRSSHRRSLDEMPNARESQFDNLVEALSNQHIGDTSLIPISPMDTNASSRVECDRALLTSSDRSIALTPVEETGSTGSPRSGAQIHLQTVTIKDVQPPLSPVPKHSSRKGPRSSTSRGGRSETSSNVKLRLLIVEDNDINRMILAKRLSLDGHTVVNTTNGVEGLEMLESDWEFDCVLMDIQMPLLNGFEATERIRQVERQRNNEPHRTSHQLNGRIPIFAVSASLYEDQHDELLKLGFDGWILKPIDFKRLRNILRGVMDTVQRSKDVYHPSCSWEVGGWLKKHGKVREGA
ncbi:uncharacterized protein FIBRA_01488 [Fibroporia radiculosa]|uniref:Phytochrome n=1 Tax=Fibroporia radiculosa TaxID=599839 RepID=J4GKD6_9APHY|nr:uncharacterized protein FIBRA_01488 [Fibroporia radiculosa]CCL99470.1 predicted protein [Fibroporia radiculosa]